MAGSYSVVKNPHFGDRGEGRNRWLVVWNDGKTGPVTVQKCMTKRGADGLCESLNTKNNKNTEVTEIGK